MSAPQTADAAQQQQDAQIGLGLTLADALAQLWQTLDVANLRQSLPAFTAVVAQLVQRYASASAVIASRHYMAQRNAAGITDRFTPPIAPPPPVQQIAQMVDWATQPLWTTEDPQQALSDAQERLSAGSQRLVKNTGRETVVSAAATDRKATGYYRKPDADPCYFCAMLATRGPVYKVNSFERANARFLGDGRAKTHNKCDCTMEPYFGKPGSWKPEGKVAEYDRLYTEATRGLHGMKPAQLAFRRAYEGRTAPQ